MPQLEHYKVFAAVARHGNLSKAAESLFITQPAVSQCIKQMEKELGAQLFVRSARGVALTPTGQQLYESVEQALSLFARAEQHLEDARQLETGTLNIGASDTLCQHYLLPYLRAFHGAHPHINLRVTNRTSRETVALLKSGRVDIGFVNLPTEIPEQMRAEPLMQLHDCFVYNPSVFPLPGAPMPLAELARHPLLMLETESSTRRYIDEVCLARGTRLTPQIELGSHDLLLSMAEIGLGLACVVREYATAQIKEGRLAEVPLHPPLPSRSIALITHRKLPLPFAARAFIAALHEPVHA